MWKKIRSNRDPRDTLYSELRKEFGPRFRSASQFFRDFIIRHPKQIWSLMLTFIVLSVIFSITFSPQRKPVNKNIGSGISQPEQGLADLIKTTDLLKESIRLKQLIDSLSALKVLSAPDSLKLYESLDAMTTIQKSLKKTPNEN